jgi:hypothetical protein
MIDLPIDAKAYLMMNNYDRSCSLIDDPTTRLALVVDVSLCVNDAAYLSMNDYLLVTNRARSV